MSFIAKSARFCLSPRMVLYCCSCSRLQKTENLHANVIKRGALSVLQNSVRREGLAADCYWVVPVVMSCCYVNQEGLRRAWNLWKQQGFWMAHHERESLAGGPWHHENWEQQNVGKQNGECQEALWRWNRKQSLWESTELLSADTLPKNSKASKWQWRNFNKYVLVCTILASLNSIVLSYGKQAWLTPKFCMTFFDDGWNV